MKHFMQPRNAVLRENEPSTCSPNPSSGKSKPPRKQKSSKENAPPVDLNLMVSDQKPSPAAKMKSPLPPRPPSSNPLKRKLSMEAVLENACPGGSDSGVQVVVRMRPPNKDEEGDLIVQKNSGDSLTITGQTFTFDSVSAAEATQEDIFQLVGAPLVENCLAGFNSSVFAYGQTGSGKTYTMWGPANALLEENFSSVQRGLTPRVFERLFARINEEQIKHAEKQLKYQCRCSFLEIYNEQITDLLDPSQRNLQIREDVKSGVYVENLTEEYVCTMKDVTQLLIKGLSNRRTGSTSINAESSRSHSVFTCVVEFRCKSVADGISSFKTSRINLVDLAGSERQKLTGAAGERLKEAGNINRSLSQLGNLINILAEVSQTGKQRHIPYRDSRLTFLLQESLGGNAKLAMVCAISPSQSCKSETFSTLRFAQRAKAIKNKAVVNEVMQEDVNFLREVIRQLKDELQRMKANGNNTSEPNGGYSTAWNARRSLNILRSFGLSPMTLPRVDDDGDEEMEIDEEAVEMLCLQVGLQSQDTEEHKASYLSKSGTPKPTLQLTALKSSENRCESEDMDINMEEEDSSKQVQEHEVMIVDSAKPDPVTSLSSDANQVLSIGQPPEQKTILGSSISNLVGKESLDKVMENGPLCSASVTVCEASELTSAAEESSNAKSPNLSIVPCDVSPLLKSPTPSVSPRVNSSRKSLRKSSMLTASQKDIDDDSKLMPQSVHELYSGSTNNKSSDVSSKSKITHASTEHLAASLHRGLEIIQCHRQSAAFRRSSYRYMYKPADSLPTLPVSKVDAGVQTFLQDDEMSKEDQSFYLCTSCKTKTHLDAKEANESLKLQLVPVDSSESVDKCIKQVPKAVEKVLAGSIRREMALEEYCAKQTAEIVQLNRLVQQYKHERECNAIIGQTREDKILRLENLMDGVLPSEEFMEEELAALMHEHKLLKEKHENHPELMRTKIELKRVQDELESYRNFHEMGEREVLLEEIQDLRNNLQFYTDASSSSCHKRKSLLKLTYSCEHTLAPPLGAIPESAEESAEEKLEQESAVEKLERDSAEEKLEKERIHWTEVESKWISLAEELRVELEESRTLAEKLTQELDTEKKCAEELKEAMQMAMEGHARMIEQYADLEEKHILLLARHRNIQEGIGDVKKAAARAGVRGAESKFINALAAEISALKAEREKERRYLRDENKGLKSQLRDTAEAVQAAGELLVRLKEAEEALAAAQKRAMDAEHETVKVYKQIDKLKKKYENEINTPNQFVVEPHLTKEAIQPASIDHHMAQYDAEDPHNEDDQQWRKEFEPFYTEDCELSKLAEPSSWFSGYDRCNI